MYYDDFDGKNNLIYAIIILLSITMIVLLKFCGG